MSNDTRTRLTELVADEVRALIARRRISAAKLAQELGWSQPYMARRMTGAQPFDLNDLQEMAGALGVKVSDILAHAERGDGSYSTMPTLTYASAPAVTGTTPWPDHPVVAGAVRIPMQRSAGPPGRHSKTYPTGR
jgi:transcriptional regulator with XRE-family HTH domain